MAATRILLLGSAFYPAILEALQTGAQRALAAWLAAGGESMKASVARAESTENSGKMDKIEKVEKIENIEIEQATTPGAFELPAALAMASGRYHGYVILGCVVKGQTDHYQIVRDSCARGLTDVIVAHRLAAGCAVLTVASMEEAARRASPEGRDAGGAAARACLTMLALKRRWSG